MIESCVGGGAGMGPIKKSFLSEIGVLVWKDEKVSGKYGGIYCLTGHMKNVLNSQFYQNNKHSNQLKAEVLLCQISKSLYFSLN